MAEQHVLWLEVPMDNSSHSMQVLNRVEHLREIVTRKLLRKASALILPLDEGKEVALLNEFKHDEEYLNALARLLDHGLSLTVVVDELNDVGVLDLLEELHLIVEDFLEGGEADALHVMPLDDFNRQKLS